MKYILIMTTALFVVVAHPVAADKINSVHAEMVAKGKKVFNKCKSCHSVKADKHKIGPSLNGIFGREAGTAKGYRYSKTMKASNITWNAVNLDLFLTKPRKFMKGTKMAFSGLKKEKDRTNIIAYILSLQCH
jgi:cytochrome c